MKQIETSKKEKGNDLLKLVLPILNMLEKNQTPFINHQYQAQKKRTEEKSSIRL